jgi:hypothetical protein
MKYSEIIQNLSNNILTNFDEVYHSAEIIVNDTGIKQPAVSFKDEWISLAPTDQKETIYIRRNGDDEVSEELKFGSCGKAYKMKSPLRVVYFKDHAKNHNEILTKLMQSVLIGGTKLSRIIRDKWKLQKDESSGDYNFGADTAYFAIDITAVWQITNDTCEEDFCAELENPLNKKCISL